MDLQGPNRAVLPDRQSSGLSLNQRADCQASHRKAGELPAGTRGAGTRTIRTIERLLTNFNSLQQEAESLLRKLHEISRQAANRPSRT